MKHFVLVLCSCLLLLPFTAEAQKKKAKKQKVDQILVSKENDSDKFGCVYNSKKEKWNVKKIGKVSATTGKQTVSKASKRSLSKRNKKAFNAAKKYCAGLNTESTAQPLQQEVDLRDLPDAGQILAADLKTSSTHYDVEGTPPLLTTLSAEHIWRQGLLDNLMNGEPTEDDCSEFWGSDVDGESAGFPTLHMAHNLRESFSNLKNTSTCIMKSGFTQAILDSGALSVIDGALPEGGIEEVFATQENRFVVQINVSGFTDDEEEEEDLRDGEEEQEGPLEQTIYIITEPSTDEYKYRANLFFCDENQLNGREIITVTNDGKYSATSFGEDFGQRYIFTTRAQLSQTPEGDVVFNPAAPKSGTVIVDASGQEERRGESFTFKADMRIGNEELEQRIFAQGFDTTFLFSKIKFTGTDFEDVRMTDGAFIDRHIFGEEEHSGYAAIEYRNTNYVAAPDSDLLKDVKNFDFQEDFFQNSPIVEFPEGENPCGKSYDVALEMDVSDSIYEPVMAVCEGEHREKNDALRDTLDNALQAWHENCEERRGPGGEGHGGEGKGGKKGGKEKR